MGQRLLARATAEEAVGRKLTSREVSRWWYRRTFQMSGTLSDADAGQLAGTVTDTSAKGTNTWPVAGTVYRAFVGTYETEGIDGKWTRSVLAGVAPTAAQVARSLIAGHCSQRSLEGFPPGFHGNVAIGQSHLRLPHGRISLETTGEVRAESREEFNEAAAVLPG